MKHVPPRSQLKKPRFGSHDLLLIRWLVQVAPSSFERASHVSILVLSGSRRRSNQIAQKLPFSSDAIAGKNWSFGAGAPSLVRKRASDQVRPPSCESWSEISAPD